MSAVWVAPARRSGRVHPGPRVGGVEQPHEEIGLLRIEGRVVGLEVVHDLTEDHPAPPDRDGTFIGDVHEVIAQQPGVEHVGIGQDDRHQAEQMATRIEADAAGSAPPRGGPVHLGEFLTDTWLPTRRRHVRGTTSYRYNWTPPLIHRRTHRLGTRLPADQPEPTPERAAAPSASPAQTSNGYSGVPLERLGPPPRGHLVSAELYRKW